MQAHEPNMRNTLDRTQRGRQFKEMGCTPRRSTLYCLPPIGIGTPLVEGLSRYLNRLATAHSLSVSDLIELDIFPLGKTNDEDRRGRRRLFHASCYLMDGSELHTEAWVRALESATMQSDLHTLTLLPYIRLCDGSWLRRKRVWCSYCLDEWRRTCSKIYEPLIWSIRVAYRCPFHRIFLESDCPCCGRSSAPLAGISQPGYCAWCLGWLGKSKGTNEPASDPYELWCSHQAAALVEAMGNGPSFLPSDAIAQAMRKLFGSTTEASRYSIAEHTGCTRRSINTWIEGSTRPRIESFLRLCHALNITPLKFLGYDNEPGLSESKPKEESSSDVLVQIRSPKRRTGRPRGNQCNPVNTSGARDLLGYEQLRYALELALQCEMYVSPRKIARQLGYSSPDRVLRKLPNLCAALNARRASEAKARGSRIRDRLERALLEWLPPKLKSIAKEFHMSSSTALRSLEAGLCEKILQRGEDQKNEELKGIRLLIEKEFKAKEMVPLKKLCSRLDISLSLVLTQLPDLKRRYEQQYLRFKGAQRSMRYENCQREVKKAVVALLERGDYPSAGRVLLLNPSLKHAGWHRIQRAIQAAIDSTK